MLTFSFIAILFTTARLLTPKQVAAHAAEQDQGRFLVLAVSLASTGASVAAIAHELGAVRDASESVRAWHTGLAFVTIVLSRLFTHSIFTAHYAHEYYAPDEDGPDAPAHVFRDCRCFRVRRGRDAGDEPSRPNRHVSRPNAAHRSAGCEKLFTGPPRGNVRR